MCSCRNCLPNLKPTKTILCPCPPPKKLLTSLSWTTRNDSSSVKAILHPECLSPRLKFGEKTRGQVTQKHLLSRNNCYCLDRRPPKPTLFNRPNSCISYQTLDDQIELKEKLPKHRLFQKENGLLENVPLNFTDQRERYEEYREREEERFKTEVDEFRQNEKSLVAQQKEDSVNTILGTQQYNTETHTASDDESRASEKSELPDISNESFRPELPKYHSYTVPEFRKEYYFETHDIDKGFSEIRRDHTCVHQFKLTDRWRADPVNKDAFGRSRCKVCDRVMEGSSVNLSTSYLFDDRKSGHSKIKNFALAYKHGLAPRTINLGRGNSKVELIVNEKDLAKLTGFVEKNHKVQFSNSLALRHQRMRAV
ncbi:hypothetical protein GWI33_015415 [Rhynchophorus ferrugineus]|uniref:Uncharacterized protein n=1 Tax=Rhynchophorus ferrugineus TaxID=354439 RepID=A0A834I5C9_RHYFE|nr:hypothetical protein GWI33_015415 [Rhynchophorus ferrugineus]